MANFSFPVFYNGQVQKYTGQLLVRLSLQNKVTRSVRVNIGGVDIIFKLDGEGKLISSVNVKSKKDPRYIRAMQLPKPLLFSVQKSLELYLLKTTHIQVVVKTAPQPTRRFRSSKRF